MIKTFYFFIFWLSFFSSLCMASYTTSYSHQVTPILIDTVKGGYKSSVAPIYGYSSYTSVKSNNDTPMEVVDADNISSTKLSSGIPFELVNGQTVQRSYAYITFYPIKLKAGISQEIIRDGLRIQFGKGDANINGVTYEKDRIKSIAAYYRGSSITFVFDVTDYITGSGMYWLADPEFLHPSYYSYDANHATDPSLSTYDIGDPRTLNNASYWGMYTIYEDDNEDIYKEMRFFLPQLSIFSLSPNIIHDIELEYFTPLQSDLEGELYIVYNDVGAGPSVPGRRFWFDRNLMLHDSEALMGGKLYSQGGTETFHMPLFSTLMLGEGLGSRSFSLSEFDPSHTFKGDHKADNTDSNGRFPVLGRSPMDPITQKPQRVTSSFGQLALGDGVELSTMVFSVNVFAPSTDLIELEARDLNGGSAIPGDEIVLRYKLLNRQSIDFDSAEEVKLHIPMEYTVYSGEDIIVEIPAGKFSVSPSDIFTTENNLLVINLPNLLPGESYDVEIPLNVGSNVTQSARSQFDSYMSSIGPVTNTEYTTDITDRNEKSWVEYDGIDISINSITRNGFDSIVTTTEDLQFHVEFSHEVEGVDTQDFIIQGSGKAGVFVEGVNRISATEYLITAEHSLTPGYIQLDIDGYASIKHLHSDNILDTSRNPSKYESYQVKKYAESVTVSGGQEIGNRNQVSFVIDFGERISGDDKTDFELGGTIANGATIYDVTCNIYGICTIVVNIPDKTGTLSIGLSSSHNLTRVSDGAGISDQLPYDSEYFTKTPLLTDITRNGKPESVVGANEFKLVFSHDVIEVTIDDFALAGAAAVGSSIQSVAPLHQGTAQEYLVTIDHGKEAGFLYLELAPNHDISSNGIRVSKAVNVESYVNPILIQSITRQLTDTDIHGYADVSFVVDFGDEVSNVDETDFEVSGDVTAVINPTQCNSSGVCIVNVTPGNETGILELRIGSSHNIERASDGTPLNPQIPSVYQHYERAPRLEKINRNGRSEVVSIAQNVDFKVVFSHPVQGVTIDDFELVGASRVGSSIKDVTPTNQQYYVVQVAHSGQSGRLTLQLKDGHNITSNTLVPIVDLVEHEEYVFEVPVQSIIREDESPEIGTKSQVIFNFSFGSEVEHADTADFVLNGTAAMGAFIDDVTCGQNGVCQVFVTPGSDTGYLSIDLLGSHNIVRKSDQVRINPASPTASQQYQRAPKLERITRVAQSEYTQGGTVEYEVFFSHAVENVDVSDFILEGDSAPDSTISDALRVSASQYRVVVGHSGHHGKLKLKLSEQNDIVSNQIAVINQPTVEESYVFKLPVLSITRDGLLAELGDVTQVRFAVNFADRVSNVSADDFELTGLAAPGAKILAPVCNDEGLCIVSVMPSGKTGTLGLKLSLSNNISRNSDDIPVDTATPAVYEEYHRSPVLLSTTRSVTNEVTQGGQVDFVVTFDRAVEQVDKADFVLEGLSAPGAKIVDVQTSNNEVFRVVVEHGGVPGKLLLGLSDTNNIESNGVKLLVNDYAQEFYMLKPDVISILRTADIELGGTKEIEFKVNFGAEVTQFDPTDFQLSGSVSIGAKITEVVCEASGECFVHVETNPDTGVLGLALSPQRNIMRASDDTLFSDVVLGETQHYQRAPTLKVIARHELPHETMGGEVQYVAIFSHHMENVDIDDFVLQGVPAENSMITAVNQTEPGVYVVDVTHSGQAGQLYLRLSEHRTLSSNQIDLLGVAQAYEDFIHYPSIDEIRIDTSKNNQYSTDIDLLDFHLLFSDPVVGLSVEDLILVGKAAEGSSIDSIEQIAQNQYLVKVRYAGVDYGDLTLKLVKYDAVREFDDGTLINSDEPSVWEKYNIQKPVYNAENSSSGGSLGFYILCFMFILSIFRHWPWTRNHFSRT
ncbi:hypothetical protein [Vibrio coralliilyticus]|uniref:hypothetical protein n=1 Tax=Vibrio coralliilyticus TaxID=190893 RepID=UPI0024091D31|nr:hypothetical protein [Vibrio coralliilyticus]WFB50812.1 hypothetical protein P6988_20145 [Vibrio coralliilyticus]